MAFVFVSQVKKEGDKDGVLQNYRAVYGLWKDKTQEKCVGVVCKDGAVSRVCIKFLCIYMKWNGPTIPFIKTEQPFRCHHWCGFSSKENLKKHQVSS